MTTKYFPTFLYKEYDEKMLALLNKMNVEGYSLTNIHFLLKFEKTEKPLKYQIDYNKRNEELASVYNELGYDLIGSYGGKHIYASQNLNADDLNSDYEAYKTSQLKQYSLGAIIFLILILLFCFAYLGPALSHLMKSLGSIYANLQLVINLLFMNFLLIISIYQSALMYMKRLSIQKDTFSYQKFKIFDAIYTYAFIFSIIFYLISSLYFRVNPTALWTLVILFVPFIFLQYSAEYKLPKTASTKKRILYTIISFMAYMAIYSDARMLAQTITMDTENYTSNRYVQITTYDYARVYECQNDKVANAIYHYLIPNHPDVTEIDSSFEKCTLSPVWLNYYQEIFFTNHKRFIIKNNTLVAESEVVENLEEDLKFLEETFKEK